MSHGTHAAGWCSADGMLPASTCQTGCAVPTCRNQHILLCKRDTVGFPAFTAPGMLPLSSQMCCACVNWLLDNCGKIRRHTASARLQALLEHAHGGVLSQARRIGLRAAGGKSAVPAGRQLLRRRRQRAQDHVAYLRRAWVDSNRLLFRMSASCSGIDSHAAKAHHAGQEACVPFVDS